MKRILIAGMLGLVGGAIITKMIWPTIQFPTDERTLREVEKFVREFMKHTNPSGGGPDAPPVPKVQEG